MNYNEKIKYWSNGKVLLTGEYLVLLGAKAFALPLRLGQSLIVEKTNRDKISWTSFEAGDEWFYCELSLPELDVLSSSDYEKATTIKKILDSAKTLNASFLNVNVGYKIQTNLSFQRNWGFGSSSTLIANVAKWANCDPFLLNSMVFGGSGYDIACAQSNMPLFYQLKNGFPYIDQMKFEPLFSDKLWLIWLNRKQNSREGIAAFQQNKNFSTEILAVSKISQKIPTAKTFDEFQHLLQDHEEIMSYVLQTETIQQQQFSDFNGTIKSLGAWGGDFVLAASEESDVNVVDYFAQNGFTTILKFNDIVV